MNGANTSIEGRGLEPSAESVWRREVAAGLAALRRLAPLREARVRLERQPAWPPYQVLAWLRCGTREIRAAARDHSWGAAWGKALARLRGQLEAPGPALHWRRPRRRSAARP